MEPLISVLMTAYNREKYIGEAIESVLASRYQNFELIIVDDASTDKTVEIAKSYADQDNRIRIYVNEQNLGQFPNRNKASEYARGEFIYYADSDDIILKDGISRIVQIMTQFPEVGIGMFCPHVPEIMKIESKRGVYKHFFERPFLTIGPTGTILRRDFFYKIGKYPVDLGVPGDMYFNLKACCHSPIVLIPFAFFKYRIHAQQEMNNKYDYLYNNYKYLNRALEELPLRLDPEELKWLDKKNKRRFVVNITSYFFKTLSFRKTGLAIQKADFSLKDALKGILN